MYCYLKCKCGDLDCSNSIYFDEKDKLWLTIGNEQGLMYTSKWELFKFIIKVILK